jgi:nucleoside-diphosphate-sugar epimerase
MKVLIVGGTRFFGKRLAEDWLQAGAEVTLLNRGSQPDKWGGRVKRLVADRKDLQKNAAVLGDLNWDIVYDQICYDSFDAEGSVEAFRGRCGRFVFTSTQSVYRLGSSLRETDFDPLRHSLKDRITRDIDYGEAKRQAEAYFFRQKDFPLCAVRLPIVLGEDDYTKRLHWHVDRIRNNQNILIPNLAARLSFIHAKDAAHSLKYLGTQSFHGPVNVCSPDHISLATLVSLIEEIVGQKALLIDSSQTADDVQSPFGVASDWYMNTDRIVRIGLSVSPIKNWLRPLIGQLYR